VREENGAYDLVAPDRYDAHEDTEHDREDKLAGADVVVQYVVDIFPDVSPRQLAQQVTRPYVESGYQHQYRVDEADTREVAEWMEVRHSFSFGRIIYPDGYVAHGHAVPCGRDKDFELKLISGGKPFHGA